jgi:hypothetical protein
MSDQIIALLTGNQSFPETSASVAVNVVNREATEEKQKLVTVNASRKLTEEAEYSTEFNKVNVGMRELTMYSREGKICAASDGDVSYGEYSYKAGGIANNTILHISVRSLSRDGSISKEDTMVLLSEHAPMIQVTSNLPYEPLAVSSQNQIFKGRGWPLELKHLKNFDLHLKPQMVMTYHSLQNCTEDNLFFIEFDTDIFTWDSMEPNVNVVKSDRGGVATIMQHKPRTKRRITTRRKPS